MLERVTLGQTRFAIPGVAADSRGIVLGKLGLLLFPTLDGVVAWLRLFADEDSLDELLPAARLTRVRTALGGRALALSIPAASSYLLDRAARLCRLAGGVTFTGSARHFIRYRDERSPYGYDVVELMTLPAGADLVVYGGAYSDDAPLAFASEAELDPTALILRLSLRRAPGEERLSAEGRALVYLAVVPGLGRGLIGYLLRNRVRCEVALIDLPQHEDAFRGPGERDAYLLLRVHDLPERLLGSLRGVPGLTLFRPVLDEVLVELGWTHPLTVSSVTSLFRRGQLYLFWGAEDRVDSAATPTFSAAERLASVRLAGESRERRAAVRAVPAEGTDLRIDVEVRLTPSLAPLRRVAGTLVPWREAGRLKKLVYTLPPVMLKGHRLAACERGLLLLTAEGSEVVPLGTLLHEAAPGLLVPLGMELVPRAATDAVIAALDHSGPTAKEDKITVFPHEGGPFAVKTASLGPLERRALARIPVEEAAEGGPGASVPLPAPQLVNDPVGRFALWGFRGPRPGGDEP